MGTGHLLFTSLALFALLCYACLEAVKPAGKKRTKSGQTSKLPPGPNGLPIIGSMLDLQFGGNSTLDILPKYGEMATVHAGSKTFIYLNSNRVVAEIIAKRSSITNTRSPMPVASGIVSRDGRSLLLPTDQWTERRRIMHHLLNGSALKQYGAWQELESVQMLAEYLFHPDRWHRHHFRYANSVIHRIVLGERLVKSGKELEELQRSVGVFINSIGKCVADWFPILDKLPRPLQLWRPHWDAIGQRNNEVFKSWWDPVRAAVADGSAPPSFVRDVLLHPESKFQGSDQDAMYVAMQLIEAGSDTTRVALNNFILAMLSCPETWNKARTEVDSICDNGTDPLRMPVLADMERMPYVNAIIKEVLRWRPIFARSPDHTLTADLEFEGFVFPAGTSFVINEIAVSNDWARPDIFLPERWLDGHELDVAHGLWGFGGGRRICVGYRLAHRGLFLNIARLVLCFDYKAARNFDSKAFKELNRTTVDKPFPVGVKIRSSRHESLVMDDAIRAGVLEYAK